MSLPPLILASGSAVRAHLLRQAGVAFEIVNSQIDEDEIKTRFADRETSPLALKLAEEKALAVSRLHPDAIIIGADQILSCKGCRFDKPRTMAEARENLLFFRGERHTLHSGIALAKSGAIIWGLEQEAHLTMRGFTHVYLDHYLAELGEKVMTSVGCYQLEGPGIQLFQSIEGDYFTILGLPLLPLLAELRRHGLVMP
ncbi:MAG: septum formation protein Maf [Rhizobiales bacterium]|nr:septum formation protein Maf [Hyphomicrobiales bacterium]